MSIRDEYLRMLADDVEVNLQRFDQATGRFLTGGGWAVTNQDLIYPLALLYTTPGPGNPYYGNDRLLPYILGGGDAWRDFQNPDGSVEFVKVDGSTWGPIFMPWSMYHWVETYALMESHLDPARRQRWEDGLRLAYTGIADLLERSGVHNIPTWHAMALYRAGQVFGEADWREGGRRMIERAVAEQTPQGYWREHQGPTTSYNLVYVHAIGLYHEFSGDDSVLDCLRRATEFHIRYVYPDGRLIETIDGRVKYHDHVPDSAHAAFSLFPRGRRLARLLVEQMQAQRARRTEPEVAYIKTSGTIKTASAEYGLSARMASAYVHYHDGPEEPIPQDEGEYVIHDVGHAIIRRRKKWFYCLSGVVTPPADNRWGMDRQNFLSVWHEGPHLMVGGGNSKDQPERSDFVVETASGREYLPSSAVLAPGEEVDAVTLGYGGERCTIEVTVMDERRLRVRLQSTAPGRTTARLLLKLDHRGSVTTGRGVTYSLEGEPVLIAAGEAGGWVSHGGWRVVLPDGASFTWPVYPFNPYAADGAAPLQEAVGVLSVPLANGATEVALEVEG